MTNETQAIYSAGYLSQMVQRSVGEIIGRLESLGHQPTLFINGVAHYNEAALCDLRKSLSQTKGD